MSRVWNFYAGPATLPLPALERALDDGIDLVMASRGLRASRIEIRQAWMRERMGKTFNLLVRLATGIPVGGALAYTDEATLQRAFQHRTGF